MPRRYQLKSPNTWRPVGRSDGARVLRSTLCLPNDLQRSIQTPHPQAPPPFPVPDRAACSTADYGHGGTLRNLVEVLSDYIRTGEPLCPGYLGPERFDNSSIWGYDETGMKVVREQAGALPVFHQPVAEAARSSSSDARQAACLTGHCRPAYRPRKQHQVLGDAVRRISNQVHPRRRQTWLDIPAHGIAEAGNGQERTRTIGKGLGEEEIRLRCLLGTRQALAELMAWSGIEEQGEAITLMIYHLHRLGPGGALPLLTPPRHEITINGNVSRIFDLESRRAISRCPDDEILVPINSCASE